MFKGEFEIVGEVVHLSLKREDGTLIISRFFDVRQSSTCNLSIGAAIVDPDEKIGIFGLRLEVDVRPLLDEKGKMNG
jgi:hypothetical protein